MIDANEGCGAGSAIDRLISVCGLVDAHTLVATQEGAPPPTYQRGSKKIDFILITPRVATAVKAVSILPLHDGYLSDHRALMLDLDSRVLFSSATSPVIVQPSRRLTSTNPVALRKYTQCLLKYIADNKIADKVAKLQAISRSGKWSTADIAQWEVVDCQLE